MELEAHRCRQPGRVSIIGIRQMQTIAMLLRCSPNAYRSSTGISEAYSLWVRSIVITQSSAATHRCGTFGPRGKPFNHAAAVERPCHLTAGITPHDSGASNSRPLTMFVDALGFKNVPDSTKHISNFDGVGGATPAPWCASSDSLALLWWWVSIHSAARCRVGAGVIGERISSCIMLRHSSTSSDRAASYAVRSSSSSARRRLNVVAPIPSDRAISS